MSFSNQLKTLILISVLTGILLLLGYLFAGMSGLVVALIFSFIMNFSTYWFSDKFVLAMYRAKPADKKQYAWLHSLVADVARKAHIPKPKVYILPLRIANAFATGRNEKNAVVAVTEGILKKLSRNELKGVIAHEIAHIKHKDILIMTIVATIAGVISYIAFFARLSVFSNDERNVLSLVSLLIAAIIAPISAMLIQLSISRTREFLADEGGARFLRNGRPLADALERLFMESRKTRLRPNGLVESTAHLFIINPLSSEGLARLFSTHPPIKERIEKLRKMKF